jgi:Fe-S-cluster containining protein
MADAERLGSPWCKRNVIGKGFLNTLCSRSAYLGGIQTKWLTVRSGPAKGFELCVCKALKGSPMKKVSCSVYDQRPEVCRKAVKPGDKSCLEIRRELQERIDSE